MELSTAGACVTGRTCLPAPGHTGPGPRRVRPAHVQSNPAGRPRRLAAARPRLFAGAGRLPGADCGHCPGCPGIARLELADLVLNIGCPANPRGRGPRSGARRISIPTSIQGFCKVFVGISLRLRLPFLWYSEPSRARSAALFACCAFQSPAQEQPDAAPSRHGRGGQIAYRKRSPLSKSSYALPIPSIRV
jgi:hypothetical protein